MSKEKCECSDGARQICGCTCGFENAVREDAAKSLHDRLLAECERNREREIKFAAEKEVQQNLRAAGRNCGNCRYFIREGKSEGGLCRRNPPTCQALVSPPRIAGGEMKVMPIALRPPVDVDDWCGEWVGVSPAAPLKLQLAEDAAPSDSQPLHH